jgi:hypothetical protein
MLTNKIPCFNEELVAQSQGAELKKREVDMLDMLEGAHGYVT